VVETPRRRASRVRLSVVPPFAGIARAAHALVQPKAAGLGRELKAFLVRVLDVTWIVVLVVAVLGRPLLVIIILVLLT